MQAPRPGALALFPLLLALMPPATTREDHIIISGNPAGFVIDVGTKQSGKQGVQQAVFAGPCPVPEFGDCNRRAKQCFFGFGQASPGFQNPGVSPT